MQTENYKGRLVVLGNPFTTVYNAVVKPAVNVVSDIGSGIQNPGRAIKNLSNSSVSTIINKYVPGGKIVTFASSYLKDLALDFAKDQASKIIDEYGGNAARLAAAKVTIYPSIVASAAAVPVLAPYSAYIGTVTIALIDQAIEEINLKSLYTNKSSQTNIPGNSTMTPQEYAIELQRQRIAQSTQGVSAARAAQSASQYAALRRAEEAAKKRAAYSRGGAYAAGQLASQLAAEKRKSNIPLLVIGGLSLGALAYGVLS